MEVEIRKQPEFLNEYIDVVNAFNVVLYEIKLKELSIPIVLNYDPSGIKKTDEPSAVGLKWSISYGPTISRSINCIPDDQEPIEIQYLPDQNAWGQYGGHYHYNGGYSDEGTWGGWIVQSLPENFNWNDFTNPNYPSIWDMVHMALHDVWDTQPDEFSLFLNGKPYDFLLSQDGQVLNKSVTDIRVVQNLMDPAYSPFSVNDRNGVRFEFINGNEHTRGVRSIASSCYDQGLANNSDFPKYCDLYNISKITTSEGIEIMYEYLPEDLDERIMSNTKVTHISSNNAYGISENDYTFSSYDQVKTNLISKISTPKETIVFLYDYYTDERYYSVLETFGEQLTLNAQKKLNKILIYDNIGTLREGYEITYDEYLDGRLQLHEIYHYVNQNEKQLFRRFSYNGNEFPSNSKQDYYQYYNNNSVGHLFPVPYGNLLSANRKFDETEIKSGILNKIEFPTGGALTIDYSANAYYDGQNNEDLYAGGVYPSLFTFLNQVNDEQTIESKQMVNKKGLVGYVIDQNDYEMDFVKFGSTAIHPWVTYDYTFYSNQAKQNFTQQGLQYGGDFDSYQKGFYFLEKELRQIDENGTSNGYKIQHYKHSYIRHAKSAVLVKEEYFNHDDEIVKEVIFDYNYVNINTNEIDRLESIYHFDTHAEHLKNDLCGWTEEVKGLIFNQRNFYYNIDFKLDSKKTITYQGEEAIVDFERYTYNNKNLLRSTSKYINNEYEKIIETNYFSDIDFTHNHFYEISLQNNIDKPYLTNEWIIDSYGSKYLVNSVFTQYNEIGQEVAVYFSKLSAPIPENQASFPIITSEDYFEINTNLYYLHSWKKYDDFGNVIEVSDENENHKSFLWGYNQTLSISSTTNSTDLEIGHTSFENNETNNWNRYGENVILKEGATAHSGEYVLKANSTAGPFKTFMVGQEAEKHPGYTASVWVKGGAEAFIHIEVNGNWSTHVRKNNVDDPQHWNLIEVEIPKSKYESLINWNLTFKVYIGGDANALWDDIRFHPSDASMTTYTYAPLIGMTSQSDANNLPTYYEYDDFGRLKLIRDHKKNILKTFEYNYAH